MIRSCYVHIPFCESVCYYCDFCRVRHTADSESHFREALSTEIDIRMRSDYPSIPLDTLYFGGGTPSILSGQSWKRIFDAISRHFVLHSQSEVTVEANPESATKEKLLLLKEQGVSRLSLGAQSFHSANLKTLGRIHSVERISAAVENARHIGFTNVSLDLIYGLPNQTWDSLNVDLMEAVTLKPEHLSFYALTLEGGVQLQKLVEDGEVLLPNDDSVASNYVRAVRFLEDHGYRQYEISNFALRGFECQHNLNYWSGGDFFAFGPSAVGTEKGRRIRNLPDLSIYLDHLSRGLMPPQEVELLDPQQMLTETILLSLRLKAGLDFRQVSATYHYDIMTEREEMLTALAKCGDLSIDDSHIRLTPQGMFRSNAIALALTPGAENLI